MDVRHTIDDDVHLVQVAGIGAERTLAGAAATLAERVAALRQQRGTLEKKADELVKLKADITKAREEQSLLAELVLAFGRNGIPAMLFASPIPEIEEE